MRKPHFAFLVDYAFPSVRQRLCFQIIVHFLVMAGAGIVINDKEEVLMVKTHNQGGVFPGGQVEEIDLEHEDKKEIILI